MARGGKREGAGRPTGSASAKSRAIADRAASEGVTPLEVMLEAMRDLHGRGKLAEAAHFARDAAPYMHPRLSATTATVAHSFDTNGLTDADLARELAAARAALPGFAGRDEEADDPPVTH